MKVSGQLQVPAATHPVNKSQLRIKRDDRWAPLPVWTFWKRESCPWMELNRDYPVRCLVILLTELPTSNQSKYVPERNRRFGLPIKQLASSVNPVIPSPVCCSFWQLPQQNLKRGKRRCNAAIGVMSKNIRKSQL